MIRPPPISTLSPYTTLSRSFRFVWSITELGPPLSPATIQEQSTELENSQRRRLGLFNPKDRTFPVPWFLIAFVLLFLFATQKVLRPFVFESIRSPRVDQVLTGRPYRLTRVMRYVVLEPAAEREGHQGVLATSRFFYWTRLNQNITPKDSTFTEVLRSEERRVGKECRSRWSPYH